MNNHLIGLTGFIGSGKGTVGDYLVRHHGYQSVSFASALKDAVAAIFCWPRHLLEGDSIESREWREMVDAYWSKKLERSVTPRWILQHLGTNVLRDHFDQNLWIHSLEKKLSDHPDRLTVITDARFPNEIQMINDLGGSIWWVKRDPGPVWQQTALENQSQMKILHPDVHITEYAWLGVGNAKVIGNNGTLAQLYANVDDLLGR